MESPHRRQLAQGFACFTLKYVATLPPGSDPELRSGRLNAGLQVDFHTRNGVSGISMPVYYLISTPGTEFRDTGPLKHDTHDMKKFLFPSLFLALLAVTACEDKDTSAPASDLTITFKALYDGKPLEKYKLYDYASYQVDFSRFNTFMTNITLLNGSQEVKLSDIEWVDFTPDSAPTDTAVDVSIVLKNVPDAEYTGIRLGYGVPPALNAKQPKDFAPTHPLSRENEFWLGWGSYIFNKIEGRVDLNNNGVFDGGLIYHCGSDAVYREYAFNLPISVKPGAAEIVVEFDLKKLFVINGAWLDLNIPYNHITSNDSDDVVIATILMDNFDAATTVKQ